LANGTALILARMPHLPLIRLDCLATAGAQFDPEDAAGLATFTAGLLDEGSQRSSATEIAHRVEQLGGVLRSNAGWNIANASLALLAQHLEAGLDLLTEVVLEPTFPEAEVDRLRQQRLADLLQQRNDPRYLAEQYFNRAIYGEGVYGRPLHGSRRSVESFTREQAEGFYRRCYGPQGRTLIAIGDLDPEALATSVEALLGSSTGAPPPPLPALAGRPLSGIEVHVVDRPGATQTELRVGHVGVERHHPDDIPLEVMNAILGGKFTSRINLNLRERRGYTYGAHSQFQSRLGPGPFKISTAVGTDVAGAAAEEILLEMRRIRDEPVAEEELDDTRSYLRGIFVNHLQTIEDLTGRLSTLAVYDLPDDYFATYLEAVDGTDRAEVQRVAREHLHPHRLVIVAVGPAAQLVPQLQSLGAVRTWDPRQDDNL
jgi:zinc protease